MFVSIDIRNESPVKIKIQENSISSREFTLRVNEDKVSDENIQTEPI